MTELTFPTGPAGNEDEPTENLQDFSYVPQADDMALPSIRLAQGLTPEVTEGLAKPGQWLFFDGTQIESFTAKVLGIQRRRALREDDQLICFSRDGEHGEGEPGGRCQDCPLSKWQNNQPPKCTLSFRYLVEVVEPPLGLGVITMSTRSASSAIGVMNTLYRLYGGGVLVKFNSKLVAKGHKKYYVPVVARMESRLLSDDVDFNGKQQ